MFDVFQEAQQRLANAFKRTEQLMRENREKLDLVNNHALHSFHLTVLEFLSRLVSRRIIETRNSEL